MSCELSVGTNGSNTKETFLSVPVLRKVFLSGNQPLAVPIVYYFALLFVFVFFNMLSIFRFKAQKKQLTFVYMY